jgi:hypothetical protein
MHWYTYVLRVCAVCYVERRDIPTLSRMRFSTEPMPFIGRYFVASKNSFSLMAVGARIISFLCRVREACTVLRKSKLFPLVQAGALSPETHPTLLLQAQCILLSRIAVCFLLRSSSDRLQVLDLCSSTKPRLAEQVMTRLIRRITRSTPVQTS